MRLGTQTLFIFLFVLKTSVTAQVSASSIGKYLDVKGRKVYYEETGSGKTLLLLHGFGRTLEDWKAFIPEFSKRYRVIAIDLPGHGRSDIMDTSDLYLHKQAAIEVLDFITTLKLDTINVVGFSSGSMIATYLATIRPNLTTKIVLIAGQLYFSETLRKFINGLGGPENFVMRASDLSQLHGTYKARLIAKQFWNFRAQYGDPSFTPDILSTIKAQTLIVHGDDDPAASVDNAFMMYKYIPGSHLWILPFGGHDGIFSPEYASEFVRQSIKFLDRN
jgi:pimeloyl-ACP methyl ester carboxylesterase